MKNSAWVPAILASVVGVALWALASTFTHKREPWDSQAYWTIAYPLAVLASAALGLGWPDRPWRWALVLFEAQFLAMCVRHGELGNLWPLGMLLFAVVAVPGIVAAQLAGRFGRTSSS